MALEKQYRKGILDNIADAVSGFARDMYATAKNARNAINIIYADFLGSLNYRIDPDFHKPYMEVSDKNFSRVCRNWQEALAGPDADDAGEVDLQRYEASIGRSYPWEDLLNDLENDNAAVLARNETRNSLIDIVRLPDGAIDASEYKRLCDEADIGYASEQLKPCAQRYSVKSGIVIDNEYDVRDLFWEGATGDGNIEISLDDLSNDNAVLFKAPVTNDDQCTSISDGQLLECDLYHLIGADDNKVVMLPGVAAARKEQVINRLYDAIDDASSAYEFAKESHVEAPYLCVIDQKIDEAAVLVSRLDRNKTYASGKTASDYRAVADKLDEMSNTLYDIVTANLIARELSEAPAEEKKPVAVPKPKPRSSDTVSLAPKLSYIAMYGAPQ